MADFILGMNAKLYFGTAITDPGGETPTTPATLTEVDNVKDLTLSMEAGEADITTRGNAGWRGTAPTLRECTAEFQIMWKTADAFFSALKTAFLANGTIALAIISGEATGDEGPVGNFSITNFSRNEELEGAIMVDVTAKLAAYDSWYTVAGS